MESYQDKVKLTYPICSQVGASIWYGVGFAVAYSGPLGSLICFFIIGVDVFFVMQCLGEMSTLFPVQGAFIELAGRFVDPSLAFSMGWNYFYLWGTNVASKYARKVGRYSSC